MKLKSVHCQKPEPVPFFPWGFQIFDRWLQIKLRSSSLGLYFEDHLLRRIAIYGLGAIGKNLYAELQQAHIEVSYGIDQNAANLSLSGLELKTLEEYLPKVDAVVITPVTFYEIQETLYQKMGADVDIIFIEDVVNYCFEKLC